MSQNFELDTSLSMLRAVWCEGQDLRHLYEADSFDRRPNEVLTADVLGWIERVKMVLRNVFYNEKFIADYQLSLRVAYDGGNDYINERISISVTNEYIKTLGQLVKQGFIKDPYSGIDNNDSKLCLVAMWFDATMEDFFANGIKPAVEGLGFDCVRIDKVEHNERIDNKIFELIRKARFIVADFTGARAGVYYESGFAAGQGCPVVYTCRSDDFEKRHFDISTINTIKYSSALELRGLLSIRIKETIGRYVPKLNEITSSDDLPF